jgi:hypothetical protein
MHFVFILHFNKMIDMAQYGLIWLIEEDQMKKRNGTPEMTFPICQAGMP